MFSKLTQLFGATAEQSEAAAQDDQSEIVAITALLIEVAKADQNWSDMERALIQARLVSKYELTIDQADRIIEEADAAQSDANDIHQFTKVAKSLDETERTALIEEIWRLVLSDDVRDPFEDTLVRRICGLIYVSDQASAEARRRATLS